jgi:hypothetical protein
VTIINTYVLTIHIGTVAPVVKDFNIIEKGVRVSDSISSLRHVILKGSPYNIGFEHGRLFKKDLKAQEELMLTKINDFIPSSFLQKTFYLLSMVWFSGIEDHIDTHSLEEMEGVSKWVNGNEDLASSLTRQVAYHGVHEVGQMFVDEDRADMGCFVVALKNDNDWIVGRNFDFDVDGQFDKNKIVKWVFPKDYHAYLSVIFPGMVGAVTGINNQGVFVSINAGGSEDWRRVGTPTTLVVKKILEEASSIEQAVKIIEKSQTFITEIFTILDTKEDRLVKVEKSPEKSNLIVITKNDVISNHLFGPSFTNDEVNLKRIEELTTAYRYNRGVELISSLNSSSSTRDVIKILRDKRTLNNKFIHYGHRASIDSLIASHSVLIDSRSNTFYINEGPGTSARYIGFDLKESFSKQLPIIKKTLDEDISLPPRKYLMVRNALIENKKSNSLINKDICPSEDEIKRTERDRIEHYEIDLYLASYYSKCNNNKILKNKYLNVGLSKKIPFSIKVEKIKASINE